MKPLLLPFLALTIVSCSTTHYQRQADKQVYSILKQTEKQVFGKSKDFTIDSKYSRRDPSQIKASQLLAESRKGGHITLSIDQALNFAANHSREYQAEKERLYLAALALTGSRNSFSPNASSAANTSVQNQSNGDVIGRANLNQRVSQNLLAGGSYSLSLANDLLKYFTGDPRKSASSLISFNIVQPLLRGAGKGIAAEGLTQANRNVIYAVRNFNNFQDEFSREIVIQYLRLLQQKESVKNELSNYESRKANTEYLRARSVDRASPQEVSDSEQGELQAKNRWINAKSRYQSSLDDFKLTLGVPTTATLTLRDNELGRLINAGLQPIGLSNKQAFQLALQHRLPLMNDVDRFDDTKRQVKIAANGLKAGLNLTANSNLSNTGNSFEKLNFNNLSTQVGIELDLPINKTTERNNYRSSLIRFEANIRSLSRSYDSLNNLIERRLREVEQFRQNYQIQKGAVKLAKNRVEGNRLRLKAGTLIFRRLSESQDALIQSQNAVTNSLIDYQRARLQLYTDMGVLDTTLPNYWLKSKPTKF